MLRQITAAALAALLVAGASAQPPEPIPLPLPAPAPTPAPLKLKSPKSVPQPTPAENAALAKTLRGLLLQHMPNPLVKANDGWGKQKEYVVGAVMLRNPKRFGPDAPRQMVNDGLWRRVTLTARKPAETLNLSIPELVRPTETTALLTVNTEMEVDFRVEHQLWTRGRQIYTGETRGHCKAAMTVKASVETKMEANPGALLPSITLVVKVTDVKLFHDKFIIDHTAGMDGPDAQKMGDFMLEVAKSVKPDLEAQLMEKANAAVLKAVGSKDIKVQLDKLLAPGGKK